MRFPLFTNILSSETFSTDFTNTLHFYSDSSRPKGEYKTKKYVHIMHIVDSSEIIDKIHSVIARFCKGYPVLSDQFPESSWSNNRISGNRSLAYPAFFGAACPVSTRYLPKFAIDKSIFNFCRNPEIIKK